MNKDLFKYNSNNNKVQRFNCTGENSNKFLLNKFEHHKLKGETRHVKIQHEVQHSQDT